MKRLLALTLALATAACQSPIPYAAQPGATDYWHPVRAKIEDHGKLMECSGFIGRDESGTRMVSLFPVDHYREDLVTGESRKVRWLMREFKDGEASFLSSNWDLDSEPATVHSALMKMDFVWPEQDSADAVWELWLHHLDEGWAAEPNRREWRATRTHNGFQEIAIIGRGGPWKTRPTDAFPSLEETSLGKFALDDVPLVWPYWSILDWRGSGSPLSGS